MFARTDKTNDTERRLLSQSSNIKKDFKYFIDVFYMEYLNMPLTRDMKLKPKQPKKLSLQDVFKTDKKQKLDPVCKSSDKSCKKPVYALKDKKEKKETMLKKRKSDGY